MEGGEGAPDHRLLCYSVGNLNVVKLHWLAVGDEWMFDIGNARNEPRGFQFMYWCRQAVQAEKTFLKKGQRPRINSAMLYSAQPRRLVAVKQEPPEDVEALGGFLSPPEHPRPAVPVMENCIQFFCLMVG